jgi:hypothetical protein
MVPQLIPVHPFFLISPFEEPQTKIQEWDCYQHIRHRKAVSKLLDSEDPESESESEPFSWGENWVPTACAWLRRLCCSSCLDMNLVILYEHNTGILCVRHHLHHAVSQNLHFKATTGSLTSQINVINPLVNSFLGYALRYPFSGNIF